MGPQVVGSPSVQMAESAFNEIINSPTFSAAPVMRALLLYLFEHQSESLNEYAIGTGALGRPGTFDPAVDASVRVQIARLRVRLKNFYAHNAVSSRLQLTIPLGGHAILWIDRPEIGKPHIPAFMALQPWVRNTLASLAAFGIILGVLSIVLFTQNRNLKASLPPSPPPLPKFWQSFLGGASHALIVVPSPVYFRWANNNILVRDVNVSEFSDWQSSSMLRQMAAKWGPPELDQAYITGVDMGAGNKILQYLEKRGQQPEMIESRNLAAESLDTQNVIFLGAPRMYPNGYVKQVLEKVNFYFAAMEPTVIRSRNPGVGEPADFREVTYSAEHRIYPGLIILPPPAPNRTRRLILFGQKATAFTSLLLSPDGLGLISEQMAKIGFPASWEMVIRAEFNGDVVQRAWPVAIRPLSSTFGTEIHH